jgi:WD40 repeat protein
VARLRHGDAVRGAAFSPDGRFVTTACRDGTVRVWDLAAAAAGDTLLQHNDLCLHVAFSPHGTRVLSTSRDGTAQLFTLTPSRHVLRTFRHAGVIIHASFSPDGRKAATASFDRTARVWDLDGDQSVVLRHDDNVWHVTFSPDGRQVATACDDGAVRVWDAATGKPGAVGPFRHQGPVKHVGFSPDGRTLASAGEDRAVRLWDLTTGKEVEPPRMHGDEVRWTAFSPDGKRLVSASLDQQARVWDLTAPGAPPRLLRHTGAVVRVRFSPDGRRVVTCSYDYTARVWDALTGEPVTPPLRHQGYVEDAAFSPDGRVVATAAQDAQVRLWDAATGELVAPPLRHPHAVFHVEFDPAGRRLVTAGGVRRTSLTPTSSGVIHLWEIPAAGDLRTLTLLAQLHCGRQVGEGENVLPVNPADLGADWLASGGRPASGFETTPARLLAWHRREASDCLQPARPARRVSLRAGFDHLDPLVAAEPGEAANRVRRAYAHAELGDFPAAEADYAAALRLGDDREENWYYLALLRRQLRDAVGFRAARAELQKRYGATRPPSLYYVLAALLGPGESADFLPLREFFETALVTDPNNLLARRWLGITLYRLGQIGPAAQNLKRATGLLGGQGTEFDWFFLGMAQRRLGQNAEARKSLDKARELQRAQAAAQSKEQAGKVQDITPFWNQRLLSQLVRDEAERVIEGSGDEPG